MKLIDIMDELDTCLEEMGEEKLSEKVEEYICRLRGISSNLLIFYKQHKNILNRRSYDVN